MTFAGERARSARVAPKSGRARTSRHSMYQQSGWCQLTHGLFPTALLARARMAASALERGEFSGGAPWRVLRGQHPGSLLKIDEPHLAAPALFDLIAHPSLGQLAAVVTGARHVQAWAVQLLIKP